MNPLLRLLFRVPARLYDHDLGWLLGSRFLCVTHTGRKSGRTHRTVLEVIGTDPDSGEVTVIAGMGPSADWYRNIQAIRPSRWPSDDAGSHRPTGCSARPRRSR